MGHRQPRAVRLHLVGHPAASRHLRLAHGAPLGAPCRRAVGREFGGREPAWVGAGLLSRWFLRTGRWLDAPLSPRLQPPPLWPAAAAAATATSLSPSSRPSRSLRQAKSSTSPAPMRSV